MNIESLEGEEIAGFRLLRQIGQGGMAHVFAAENLLDPAIRRAIKIVRPELAAREEFVFRFTEEARILETLQHPNIVRFYGVRRERELLLMELELLTGETLHQRLSAAGGQLPLASILEWMRDGARGVAAAHERDIVHRDLKPENIYLDRASVKILDFGIARARDEADRARHATETGKVPGTPAYMAPEVCSGAVPSAASDVYALGMVLYELLLGYHPFLPPGTPALSGVQLMFAHTRRTLEPIRAFRPQAPVALEKLASRALARSPEERYPDARAFAEAIDQLISRRQVPSADTPGGMTRLDLPTLPDDLLPAGPDKDDTTPPARRRRPLLIGGAVAIVAAAAGLIATAPTEEEPSAGPEAGPIATGPAIVDNPWVLLVPPPGSEELLLGVGDVEQGTGFAAARGIVQPPHPYELQRQEVSWSELDAWLLTRPDRQFPLPRGVPADAVARRELPVTGAPWAVAQAYCRALGGSLPTEEQWEYAGRGASLQPYPWGAQPMDPGRLSTLRGPDGHPTITTDADQDRSAGAAPLLNLLGNVREWTVDLYREDRPVGELCGADATCTAQYEAWTTDGGNAYYAVRGLPLRGSGVAAPVGLAWRSPLCGSGPCTRQLEDHLSDVGFRCARVPPTAP